MFDISYNFVFSKWPKTGLPSSKNKSLKTKIVSIIEDFDDKLNKILLFIT